MEFEEQVDLEKHLAKKRDRKAQVDDRMPKWNNITRGWLHQGFTYLDSTQRFYRMVFETTFFSLLTVYLSNAFDLAYSSYLLWVSSAFITHTFFWVFDGNWWAGMMFTFPWIRNPGEKATLDYLNSMVKRLDRNFSISGVLIYGSISRGEWHDRSDLDIRFIRRPGIPHGLRSVLTLYRERIIALLKWQPLDVYIADDIDFLKKMRNDERPVILKNDDKRLDTLYPGNQIMSLQKLSGQ